MNEQQREALIDLILIAVTIGMFFTSVVVFILGDFAWDTLNLVVIGGLCGWHFYHRRLRDGKFNIDDWLSELPHQDE